MTKTTVEEYNSTMGLNAIVPGHKTRKLVRIAYDKMSDGTYRVQVESGHNLAPYINLGVKTLSHEQIQNLTAFNDVEEFRNFASLFDIEA